MNRMLILMFLVTCSNISVAQEDNSRLKDAEQIFHNFEIATYSAKGASQVSQLADQAQMQYSRMIIAQNEEIIALLKQLAAKPVLTQTGNTSSSSSASSKTKK